MYHLYLPHERLNHEGASPLYRLLMGQGYAEKTAILLDGVEAGWLTDPNERGPEELPLLLGYLGTFPAHEREDVWTQERLTSELCERWDGVSEGPRPWSTDVRLALALLDRGANPWAKDRYGRDALDQVNSLMWTPVWERLMQRPDAPTLTELAQRRQALRVTTKAGRQDLTAPWLHAAAADDRLAWLDHLLQQGLDVNQRDDMGRTPLFYAASADTVRLLLDHDADPLVLDAQGAMANRVWGERVRNTELLNAMNALVQPLLNERFQNDPDALRAQNRPALYHLATTSTKDATLTFMRSNGFTVNDRWTVDGQTTSLMGYLALSMLAGRDRSPLMQHLMDRVDDPWFESVPGVPDVVLVWATSGMDTLARRVDKRLRESYGLNATSREAWVAFVQDLVPALERLGDWLATHRPEALPGFSTGVAHRLNVTLKGRSNYVDGKELERWRKEAQINPDLVLTPFPLHGVADRHHVSETLAPADWATARDTNGDAWFWRWAMQGVRALAHPLDDQACDRVAFHVGSLLGRPATATEAATEPVMPYDHRAVYVLVGLLGNPISNRARTLNQVPTDSWDLTDPVRLGLRTALDAGVVLDTSLPGFDALFQRVRAHFPNLARDLESRVLQQTLRGDPATDPSVARARSRL